MTEKKEKQEIKVTGKNINVAGMKQVLKAKDSKEEKVFTRVDVIELLQKQIKKCSESAVPNCTEYTAKLKILETKLIDI